MVEIISPYCVECFVITVELSDNGFCHTCLDRAIAFDEAFIAKMTQQITKKGHHVPHSTQAKAKISAKNLGRKHGPMTAQHRQKIGAANKGKIRGPEALANLRASRPLRCCQIIALEQGRCAGACVSGRCCAPKEGFRWISTNVPSSLTITK
jgi:hypothetical protein